MGPGAVADPDIRIDDLKLVVEAESILDPRVTLTQIGLAEHGDPGIFTRLPTTPETKLALRDLKFRPFGDLVLDASAALELQRRPVDDPLRRFSRAMVDVARGQHAKAIEAMRPLLADAKLRARYPAIEILIGREALLAKEPEEILSAFAIRRYAARRVAAEGDAAVAALRRPVRTHD